MSRQRRNHITVPDDPSKGPPLLVCIFLLFIPPVGSMAGLYLLLKRFRYEFTRRKYKDYRHYAGIIGDRASVSLREIATRLGKSVDEVAADVQTMINEDMIDCRAYIDRNSMTLILQDDIFETEFVDQAEEVRARPRCAKPKEAPVETVFVEPKPAPKSEPKPAEKPKAKPAPKSTGMENEDFEAKLREIRQLNDDIENELVSQRIDRIGALTASIFRVVREKPEHTDEVRKFMNYYLPTTLKLLKSYSLMEKQSYQGENIAASRKKIEDVLETLVHAFEQQQDKLFRAEALDVEIDISVLETMMASDGLTEQTKGLHL